MQNAGLSMLPVEVRQVLYGIATDAADAEDGNTASGKDLHCLAAEHQLGSGKLIEHGRPPHRTAEMVPGTPTARTGRRCRRLGADRFGDCEKREEIKIGG